jgi:hypothetical protein
MAEDAQEGKTAFLGKRKSLGQKVEPAAFLLQSSIPRSGDSD